MVSEQGQRLLRRGGTQLLACGFAARLLFLDGVNPVVEATAIGLLLVGSGLILVHAALLGHAPAGIPALLLPLLVIWAARSGEPLAIKRAIDVWAACMGGFALRELARRHGLGPELRRTLTAAAIVLGVFGIAQTAYLRREVAAVAHEMGHAMTMDEQGRAFLASWRAAATFISANAFGGFLLLAGLPLLAVFFARVRDPAGRGPILALGVLAAVAVAGFVCAGSAGASLAGALGIAIAGAAGSKGRARVAFLAALVVLAAAAAVLIGLAASGTDLSGKLRTLQERLDYNKAGVRLLRATWPEGAGLEQTRLLMRFERHDLEASSRSIHDWWLQGLVEGGVAFVPVAAMLLWFLAGGARKALADGPALPTAGATDPALPTAGATDPALPGCWRRGLLAGVAIDLLLEPFVTVLPYSFGHWTLHALVTWALAFFAGKVIWRLDLDDPAYARGLAAGCIAFLLHGLADFDLYVPGVMVAFAAALVLLDATGPARPSTQPDSRVARILAGVLGWTTALLPVAVIMLAKTNEHAH